MISSLEKRPEVGSKARFFECVLTGIFNISCITFGRRAGSNGVVRTCFTETAVAIILRHRRLRLPYHVLVNFPRIVPISRVLESIRSLHPGVIKRVPRCCRDDTPGRKINKGIVPGPAIITFDYRTVRYSRSNASGSRVE